MPRVSAGPVGRAGAWLPRPFGAVFYVGRGLQLFEGKPVMPNKVPVWLVGTGIETRVPVWSPGCGDWGPEVLERSRDHPNRAGGPFGFRSWESESEKAAKGQGANGQTGNLVLRLRACSLSLRVGPGKNQPPVSRCGARKPGPWGTGHSASGGHIAALGAMRREWGVSCLVLIAVGRGTIKLRSINPLHVRAPKQRDWTGDCAPVVGSGKLLLQLDGISPS